jgi:hypothetical protein
MYILSNYPHHCVMGKLYLLRISVMDTDRVNLRYIPEKTADDTYQSNNLTFDRLGKSIERPLSSLGASVDRLERCHDETTSGVVPSS